MKLFSDISTSVICRRLVKVAEAREPLVGRRRRRILTVGMRKRRKRNIFARKRQSIEAKTPPPRRDPTDIHHQWIDPWLPLVLDEVVPDGPVWEKVGRLPEL